MDRSGVSFSFDLEGAKTIRSHSRTSELRAAALAAPAVAKKGILIAGHKNHEDTNTTTLTYAARVVINDIPVNVAVAIQFTSNGRPRAVNFDADGLTSMKEFKKATGGPRSGLTNSQVSYLLTSDDSDSKVPQKKENVNFSMRKRLP